MRLPKYNLAYNTRDLIKSSAQNTSDREYKQSSIFNFDRRLPYSSKPLTHMFNRPKTETLEERRHRIQGFVFFSFTYALYFWIDSMKKFDYDRHSTAKWCFQLDEVTYNLYNFLLIFPALFLDIQSYTLDKFICVWYSNFLLLRILNSSKAWTFVYRSFNTKQENFVVLVQLKHPC